MRHLILAAMFLVGCSCRAEDKPAAPEKRPTYTEAVQKFEATVAGLAETVGNQANELNGVKNELGAVQKKLNDVEAGVEEVRKLLSVDTAISIEVPKAPGPPQLSKFDSSPAPVKADAPPAAAAGRRILFQGKPIDVNAWLRRSVTTVEIRGDVDKHLRDHGLEGDFSRFSRDQKIQLHSVVHTYGVPLKSSAPRKVVVKAPAVVLPQASNCANGNCRRQPMTWLWRR